MPWGTFWTIVAQVIIFVVIMGGLAFIVTAVAKAIKEGMEEK